MKLSFNNFRPDPKPEKVIKPKKVYQYKKKPTGEKDLFEAIWLERGPYSQIDGSFLGEFNVSYFMHIIPKAKNKYPNFKLNPECIVLGDIIQHHNWDNARHKCTGPEWKWLFEKEAELKEEYKRLYPEK